MYCGNTLLTAQCLFYLIIFFSFLLSCELECKSLLRLLAFSRKISAFFWSVNCEEMEHTIIQRSQSRIDSSLMKCINLGFFIKDYLTNYSFSKLFKTLNLVKLVQQQFMFLVVSKRRILMSLLKMYVSYVCRPSLH